ncbi:hypothetical protein E3Q16_00062 [Wallemia mellicola]|nr:hypothetical protein E3Q16_00062 [Wallemia mellicola]TIC14975.1 hypothetical protein E3Q14_00496 [Wallemia mellicola]
MLNDFLGNCSVYGILIYYIDMRFRCVISNVKLFKQITQAFSKLLGNEHAVIRFTKDMVYVGQSGVDTALKSWLWVLNTSNSPINASQTS